MKKPYGLYEQRPDGVWVPLYPALTYPKVQAVRVFQDTLLAPSLYGHPHKRMLKPVKLHKSA